RPIPRPFPWHQDGRRRCPADLTLPAAAWNTTLAAALSRREEDRFPVLRALDGPPAVDGALRPGRTDAVDRARGGGRGARRRRCLLPGAPLRPSARLPVPAAGRDRCT